MASTTTPNKTQGTALLALTQQATAAVTISSAIDVSSKFDTLAFIKMGRTTNTALSNNVKFRIEASAKSSGNDEWVPLIQWTSANGTTAAATTTLNGATTAGNTTSVLTSGTGFTAGSYIYFRETGTPANSEWSREVSISTNTITLEEAQTRNHTNGIAVTTLAESWCFSLPQIDAAGRIRLVVDTASAASGVTVDILAWLTTYDSTTST